MKIFEFKFQKDSDWVFAPDEEDAREFYMGFIGACDLEGVEVTEVPESEWTSNYIINIEEPEPEESENYNEDDYAGGYKIQCSFAEYAKNNFETDLIATTNF